MTREEFRQALTDKYYKIENVQELTDMIIISNLCGQYVLVYNNDNPTVNQQVSDLKQHLYGYSYFTLSDYDDCVTLYRNGYVEKERRDSIFLAKDFISTFYNQ